MKQQSALKSSFTSKDSDTNIITIFDFMQNLYKFKKTFR